MKWWPWRSHEDYGIRVSKGSKGHWRWSLLHAGDVIALSPVKGWPTAEEARDAAYAMLDGIGAAHIEMQK